MPANLDCITQTARPTMRDVAAPAEVTVQTVSRVINEVPTVDPALARRVQAAADKLGFRPNLAAPTCAVDAPTPSACWSKT